MVCLLLSDFIAGLGLSGYNVGDDIFIPAPLSNANLSYLQASSVNIEILIGGGQVANGKAQHHKLSRCV